MIPFVVPSLPLALGVVYQTYNQPRACFEALRSFRRHFPDVAIRLISDNGGDFSAIARRFDCDYVHDPIDTLVHVPPCAFPTPRHAVLQMRRAADAAKFLAASSTAAEWMLILEDDVLTRGPIKHPPLSPISGPCTCSYSEPLNSRIRTRYPQMRWVWGYSGCGGTILHIPSLLDAIDKPDAELLAIIQEGEALDGRIAKFGDALLTYLMLAAGYANGPPWLDQSERSQGRGRPDAAFDHQFKTYYDRQ